MTVSSSGIWKRFARVAVALALIVSGSAPWSFKASAQRPPGGSSFDGFGGELTGEAAPPAEPLSLWYRRPARQWVEALAVGNGRLGAMVFGGVTRERMRGYSTFAFVRNMRILTDYVRLVR